MPLLSSTPVTTTTGTTTTSTRPQSPTSAPLPSTAVAAATPRSAAPQTGTNTIPLHTVFNLFSMTDALHPHDADRNRDCDRDLDRDLDSYSEASVRESKRLSANSEGSGPAPGSIFPASALAQAFADTTTTTTTAPAPATTTATATAPLSSSDNTFTNYNTMAFHNGYTTAATAHRSSFDYGLGLGQGLGQAGSRIGANVHGHGLNDIRKSPPFATAFADFKQPFLDVTQGSNTMNPPATAPAAAAAAAIPNDAATAFLKPPPFTASGTTTSAMSGFENPISPLTPQKGTFSNEMQHAASLSMTDTNTNSKPSSPLMNMQDYTHRQVSPSRLSHSSSNSMGMLTNIDETILDSNGSFGSAPLPLEKVRTKSVFDDVWNGTAVSKDANTNANVNTKTFTGDVPKTVPHESIWCSPPPTHAAPLRRFSYDAATASTFIPQNVQAFDPFDFSAFAKNLGSVTNNGNYPLNSLNNANGLNSFTYPQQQQLQQQQYPNNSFVGNNTRHASLAGTGSSLQQFVNGSHYNNFNDAMSANQYNSFGNAQTNRPLSSYGMNSNINTNVANHNLMSVDMDFKPSDEHIAHCLAQVAAYLGFPSAEVLDIEKYLGHLNNHALPHLAMPSDPSLGANYEIVACCFKNARIDVFCVSMHDKQRHLQNLKVGDLVIVEADRGRDLGKVVKLNISTLEARLLRYAQYIGRKAALSKDDDMHKRPILNFPKPVQRYAKNEELITIDSKIADEMNAIEVCQGKVRDFGLNMIIVDAEYQWDMKKMTFYYNSDARIDFRDLVKELFRVYKIRIWMSKKSDIC